MVLRLGSFFVRLVTITLLAALLCSPASSLAAAKKRISAPVAQVLWNGSAALSWSINSRANSSNIRILLRQVKRTPTNKLVVLHGTQSLAPSQLTKKRPSGNSRTYEAEIAALLPGKSYLLSVQMTFAKKEIVRSPWIVLEPRQPRAIPATASGKGLEELTLTLSGENVQAGDYICSIETLPSNIRVRELRKCVYAIKPKTHCVTESSFTFRLVRLSDGVASDPASVTFNWNQIRDAAIPLSAPPIPDEQAYVGVAGDGKTFDYNAFVGKAGLPMGIAGVFADLEESTTDDFQVMSEFIDTLTPHHTIPMVTITTVDSLNSIDYDHVEALACYFRYQRIPVFVRWLHEMNANWFSWGQAPGAYIEAFRKAAQILHQISPNVSIVWSPNQGWGYPWATEYTGSSSDFALLDTNHDGKIESADDPYAPYYPGDAYVDWIGTSIFHLGEWPLLYRNSSPNPLKWASANGYQGSFFSIHDFSLGHGKPMMLAETGAFYDLHDIQAGDDSEVAVKNAWISQIFNLDNTSQPNLRTDFPNYKALVWFNVLKLEKEYPRNIDWRIDENSQVLSFFVTTVNQSYFKPRTY